MYMYMYRCCKCMYMLTRIQWQIVTITMHIQFFPPAPHWTAGQGLNKQEVKVQDQTMKDVVLKLLHGILIREVSIYMYHLKIGLKN